MLDGPGFSMISAQTPPAFIGDSELLLKYVCSHQAPGRDLNCPPGCLYLKGGVTHEVGHNLGLKDDYTNPKLLMYDKKEKINGILLTQSEILSICAQ